METRINVYSGDDIVFMIGVDTNSNQPIRLQLETRVELLSECANVGTAVANKEMIFFEDDHARLLRRRDAILISLEAIQD